MDEPGLYEKVLAALDGAPPVPVKPPRASASIVPWRRASVGGELEVFWVRRAESLLFMGGWYAFPGGGIVPADAAVPVSGAARGLNLQDDAPGLLAGALRELFEETGLLVATSPVDAETAAAAREQLLRAEQTFPAVLAQLAARLDAAPLVFAGRWLTPPFSPLRYDNRFFLLEVPVAAVPRPVVLPGELAAGEWINPVAALARWKSGEVMVAPPILHILRVLAEEGPERGRRRLAGPGEADLGPFRRIEFRPGVLLFPLRTLTLPPAAHTNAFLLGNGETVLVDPGSSLPEEIARLEAALYDARTRFGSRITAIWLTHHHPDHVGGVEALRRSLGVPVFAHESTAERLASRGIPVDAHLRDNQVVELAGDPPMRVRVLHTPGHTRGHLCFFDESGGSLLGGDMVASQGTIVIDPPEGDMDDYLASLERLRDLGARTLFPSHGVALKDPRAKLEEYLEHRRWREQRVLQAWRAGLRDPTAMLPVVYDDVAPAARPLAERQVVAHLERLERLGALGSFE